MFNNNLAFIDGPSIGQYTFRMHLKYVSQVLEFICHTLVNVLALA